MYIFVGLGTGTATNVGHGACPFYSYFTPYHHISSYKISSNWEALMWLILLGIIFLYFLIQGNIWGIVVVILFTAVALPGIGGPKAFETRQIPLHNKAEKYKQGDIYGYYSDPLALQQQKKEREELERKGRERI